MKIAKQPTIMTSMQQSMSKMLAKPSRRVALRILELGTSSAANLRECKTSGKTSVLLDAIPSEDGSLRYTC